MYDFYGASSIPADVSTTLTTGHTSVTTTVDYVGSHRTSSRGFDAGPLSGQDGGNTSYGSLSTTTFTNYLVEMLLQEHLLLELLLLIILL